jgi:hypothetical protein
MPKRQLRWLSTIVLKGMALGVLAGGLSTCEGALAFLPRPEVSREWIHADLTARLGDSELSTFELHKQTVGWVDQHMPARFGEPIHLSDTGEDREGHRRVWVAYLEGTIARTIMPNHTMPRPGTNPQVTGFSKVLMLISPDHGSPISVIAKPLPPR